MGSTASSRDKRRVLFLALVAALPTFALRAGELNADTKLYLTSSPARLLASAAHAWDPSQFLGYVPHQAVGYLWPMGPFFWIGDTIGVADWVMQRLWLTMIFTAAGTGVYFFLRRLGYRVDSATAGALCFQVTPYVLSYQSRTSVMLLPWAAVGWLALVSLSGPRSRSWKQPSLVALIVFTVGGINATALIMIAPVVLVVAISQRMLSGASHISTFLWRTAVLSALCSTWWMSMLVIQSRYGADVLSYSETLEAVSSTSTSFEVLRGMGYWLNYVVSGSEYGTSASISLISSPLALVASSVIPVAALVWIAVSRHRFARLASVLVFVGLVIATGAYGMSSSSALMRPLAENSSSSLALALRSSTRAIPVLLLGIAVAWAGVAEAVMAKFQRRWFHPNRLRKNLVVPTFTLVVLVVSMPSLRSAGVTDSSLSRPANAPTSWRQAAAILDSSISPTARVLQTPGQEFGAYEWGFTVDPVWPTISDRPLATRDLLPLGGVQAMDQLYALDDATQDGTTNAIGIRNTSRRLGAGAVLLPGDLDESRFQTAPQEVVLRENGLIPDESVPSAFGTHHLLLDSSADVATVVSGVIQVSGSGDGLVSADAHDLISNRVVEYTADQDDRHIAAAAESGIPLIVTDSNRIRARHWRTSFDTVGYSEDGTIATALLRDDYANRRLSPFPHESETSTVRERTVVRQVGNVSARATSYGTPLLYWPEHRPAAAIDGDMSTSWTTSAFANPTGEALTLTSSRPFTQVRLVQPVGNHVNRWITQISYSTDNRNYTALTLDSSSRQTKGQLVQLGAPASLLTLRIDVVDWTSDGPQEGLDGVGFAEVQLGSPATREVTDLPSRALMASSKDRPVAFDFSRVRARASSTWRSDPETSLSRVFVLPGDSFLQGEVHGAVALDANEQTTAPILGVSTFATTRSTRDFSTAGWKATDGLPDTSWVSAPGVTRGAQITFLGTTNTEGTISQPAYGDFSRIKRGLLSDGRHTEVVSFDEETGEGRFTAHTLDSGRWTLTISEVTTTFGTDDRTHLPVADPIAVSEIRGRGVMAVQPRIPTRNTMVPVTLAGEVIRLTPSWSGTIDRPKFLASVPTTAVNRGEVAFETDSLHTTGLSIDDVFLVNDAWSSQETQTFGTTSVSMTGGPTRRTVAFPGCEDDCWFVFSESYNVGWSAKINGVDLGAPKPVNGGFNGWLLPADTKPGSIVLEFTPQKWLTAGLLVTTVTVFVLLVLVLRSMRSTSRTHRVVVGTSRKLLNETSLSQPRPSFLVLLASAALVALVSQPVYFVPAFALLVYARKQNQWAKVRLLVVSWLVFAVGLALARILGADPPIRFDWPKESAFVHWHLIACVALITILAHLPAAGRRRSVLRP